MPARKSAKKVDKPKTIKVKATVTIETSFLDYENDGKNQKALDQIQGWIAETLNDEEQIPLFVGTRSGEQTQHKTVKVTVEQLNRK